MSFLLDDSFPRALPELCREAMPAAVAQPRLCFLNLPLAQSLGLPSALLEPGPAGQTFCGRQALPGARPVAQAYAGHQFGGFSPVLGDGRALVLGEVVDAHGQRHDLAFKGSGRTPFSRRGDGKAALGPMLREALVGEYLHACGVPSTRALAVVGTGEPVLRDRVLPGAILTRVAHSHLRVGTFEYAANQAPAGVLERLLEYTRARHDPQVAPGSGAALGVLQGVALRQAQLLAQWMNLGFIHGVMNTDNMALSGQSIDFGPCAFLEAYDPATVYSSIDTHGRYAFGNQPAIAQWNLARFAEALLPLMAGESDPAGSAEVPEQVIAQASAVIDAFPEHFLQALRAGQRAKLGLAADAPDAVVTELANAWLDLLQTHAVDHTLGWHGLAAAAQGRDSALRALFADPQAPRQWLARWQAALGTPGPDELAARLAHMRLASPWLIARNHQVEKALAAATDEGELAPFNRLLDALTRPHDVDPALADLAAPAPKEFTGNYRTFCGT